MTNRLTAACMLRLPCFLIALFLLFAAGCSDAGDLLDLAFNPPGRHPINKSITGVNNFFVNREFGTIDEQFHEIRDTLGLRYVRVLLTCTDDVLPSAFSNPNTGFFDDILSSIPSGMDVLVVIAHAPSWIVNSSDPRSDWIRHCFRPLVERYANVPGIVGFEVWNEPDRLVVPADAVLGLDQPANYFDLLEQGSYVVRTETNKLVVMAATESIQQSFPTHLNYNKQLRDLGAEGLTDVWNVHYYGQSFESVVTRNGVADFLNGLTIPVWVTESGETGANEQLPYVETAWPFLQDEVPGIERFYYYQFGEPGPQENNYGLRTTDPAFPVSDLYIWLRDNG